MTETPKTATQAPKVNQPPIPTGMGLTKDMIPKIEPKPELKALVITTAIMAAETTTTLPTTTMVIVEASQNLFTHPNLHLNLRPNQRQHLSQAYPQNQPPNHVVLAGEAQLQQLI